ncbi:MAG: alpha/beta fold hydrolase [Pseudomonadota bacterium]|nr:alpha/beta fold hydrolase [Pseudomonadota bacterium]
MTELLINGPISAEYTVVLAHGAGAPMDSAFMERMAVGLAGIGLRVVRFEFPYMVKHRKDGTRRLPDKLNVLTEAYRSVLSDLNKNKLIIGGKSMGGRIASMVADQAGVAGVVCLGYPFHPPGKPEKIRTEHLRVLRTPMLILQGDRDPFGYKAEIARYNLATPITLYYLPDGDHDLKPRRRSGITWEENLHASISEIEAFLENL